MEQEYKELIDKLNILTTFIYTDSMFNTYTPLEQARIIQQTGFMEAYAETLAARIEATK